MNDMMTKADWGTTAYLTEFDMRKGFLIHGEVPITVGRKYITIQERWSRKFYIENGLEFSEYTTGCRLFPSREVLDEYIHYDETHRRLDKYLSYDGRYATSKMTIEQQEQLLKFFEGESENT